MTVNQRSKWLNLSIFQDLSYGMEILKILRGLASIMDLVASLEVFTLF